jgi:hypothetical protein
LRSVSEFVNGERAKAEGMPESRDKFELLGKVRQAETAANVEMWATSPGQKRPK